MTTRRRVLLIGGTGVFGRRLATHLGGISGLDLVIASRNEAKSRDVAAAIAASPDTTVSGIGLDHRNDLDARLKALAPWLVIDASGPFQGAGYDVSRAALSAGAHVVDLADARDYILGYGAALDDLARERRLVALAGASSTPALSTAAVAALTEGWQRIDTIDIAITPGGRSAVGEAVIAAILSYAGRPIPVWREGGLQQSHGWLENRRIAMRGLGRRRVAAVETVDAQWLGPRLGVRSRITFWAGLEAGIEQWGVMALARLRKAGLIERLEPLIPVLLTARTITRLPTSDRGGMTVEVAGLDPDGKRSCARWSLLAARGDGPQVPTLPAAAALRALLAGRIAPGARPAAGVLTLDEIEAELKPYAIDTRREGATQGSALLEELLGPAAFAALPAPLKAFHGAAGEPIWRGRAEISTGANPVSRLLRRMIGLPEAGSDVPLSVSVERIEGGAGPAEAWTRNFGGARFASRLYADANMLHERFGPISFQLGLSADKGGIALPVLSARCFGIPLPAFLLPRSLAREDVDELGRFRVDVKLTLPGVGLLTHYRGWLVPASPSSNKLETTSGLPTTSADAIVSHGGAHG
jgi:saccharopine dehydrogenase-like NADP-dependent oxidoreductase